MRVAVALSLAVALMAAPADAKTGKWKRIFDGRSLKGWTPKVTGAAAGVNLGNSFTVANGAIQVTYDGWQRFDGRFGHLAYNKPFSAFRLRFQYRFFGKTLPDVEDWQHSNSGAMLLAQSPWSMTRDQKFPVSLEAQLLGAERPNPQPSGNLCTPGTNVVIDGKLETEHCILSTSPILANNHWISAEFEVTKDGKVTHFINGKPVFHYSDPQYDPTDADAKPLIAAAGGALAVRKGYIYLQSEGHPVEFRNIEVMELN
jgi:hypothetical protein